MRSCAARPETPADPCSTASHRPSSGRGMPARTCRGRSTRSCSVGAGATRDADPPGHRPVSAQYSSAPRSATSRSGRASTPCRAASTQQPITRTDPAPSTRTFSGTSRPCATPRSWATAIASATSETIQAARRAPSGPSLASITSSELPEPHSLTTKQTPSMQSASSTRSSRRSRTAAEARAASSSAVARSPPDSMTCTATWRCRTRSWARQNRPEPLSLRRSTRR